MAENYTWKDAVAEHPAIDHVVPTLAVLATLAAREAVTPPNFDAFLVGVATVSALVLTAATFVCTLIYQSEATDRMKDVRLRFAPVLRRNWMSIFILVFATSVAPLVALLLVGTWVAPLVGAWALTMLTMKALRTVYWLHYVLLTQHVDDARPRAVVPAERMSA